MAYVEDSSWPCLGDRQLTEVSSSCSLQNSVDASHSPSRLSIAPGSATVSKPIADLLAVIALAKAHTRQLHETMRAAASSGGSSAADEQTLVEHATVFFQSVRKVAGTTRAVFESERREFRRDLKVGLGKLTRLTMERCVLGPLAFEASDD
jgi:hypothetical protein